MPRRTICAAANHDPRQCRVLAPERPTVLAAMPDYPTLHDIDFEALYRAHMAAVGRPKSAADWDARAAHATLPPADSGYTADFVARMNLRDCRSLLDVGCGPGHIALAVADRMDVVHGLDHSPRMLERLQANAQAQGARNVQAWLRSWADDWDDLPVCDIVVASRSTLVPDMGAALRKLNRQARLRVCVSSLVGGQFRDVAALQAAGQPVPAAQPDYLYIVNILYAMGIHARVDFLPASAGQAPWAFVSWDR
jgi:SAM-dependent methyltransferase